MDRPRDNTGRFVPESESPNLGREHDTECLIWGSLSILDTDTPRHCWCDPT